MSGILTGATVEASYKTAQLSHYKNNPLIEALQPILPVQKVIKKLTNELPFRKSDCNKSDELRAHCIFQLTRFIEPMEKHIQIEQALSILIRDSYIYRDPLTVNGVRLLREGAQNVLKAMNSQNVVLPNNYKTSGSGLSVIGTSGMGKTTALNNILLKSYPAQVIIHGQYKGHDLNFPQIIWLKLECPPSGSTKGLCLNFFQALDKLLGRNYYQTHKKSRASAVELIPEMAQLAATFRIGAFVIDEIQNLCQANFGGQDEMLNFFVSLKNMIGIPIVLIGTYKAWGLLNTEFRQTRRAIEHFGIVQWDRMLNDGPAGEWQRFLRGLWKYQWTKRSAPLDDQMIQTMYDYSQGITDVAVKLFMMSQWRAIISEEEIISPETIAWVSSSELKAFQPVITAIRLNDRKKAEEMMDVFLTEFDMEVHYQKILHDVISKKKFAARLSQPEEELQDKEQRMTAAIKWLMEAGVTSGTADTIVKKIISNDPNVLLPELKNKAFQIYQSAAAKAGKKARLAPKAQTDRKSVSPTNLNLDQDIVALGQV